MSQLALTVVNEADGNQLIASRLADGVREMSSNTEAFLDGPEGLKLLVETVWETLGMTGTVHSERFDFRGAYSLADLI